MESPNLKLTSRPYKRTVPYGRTERTKRDGSNPWQIGPMSNWSARAGSGTRQDWTIFSDTRDDCRGGKRVSPCPVHHPFVSCPASFVSCPSKFPAGTLWQRDSMCPIYVLSSCMRGFLPDYCNVVQEDSSLTCLEFRTAMGLYSKLACVKN